MRADEQDAAGRVLHCILSSLDLEGRDKAVAGIVCPRSAKLSPGIHYLNWRADANDPRREQDLR